jgi:hypothetical protein
MRLRWLPAALCCSTFAIATMDSWSNCYAQVAKPQLIVAEAAVAQAVIDESKDTSVVVVAINSLESVVPNIQHIARTVGVGAAAGTISTLVNQYSTGLDKKRPIGVFLDLDESGQPAPVGCLPISNLTDFFDQLAVFGEPNDLGGGLYEFSFGTPVYAKKLDDWLYIAQSEDALAGIVAGRGNSLANMVQKYDIRIQANPQNIPDDLVDFIIGQMQTGLDQAMAAQRENMEPDEAAAAKASSEQMIAQMQEGIEGTEKMVLGLSINKQEKKSILDFGSQFVAGSKYAKQMEKAQASKSAFTGIPQENSMMTLQTVQLVEAEDIAQLEKTLEASLKAAFNAIDEKSKDAASAAKAKDFIARGVDILVETAKQGKLDSAIDVGAEGALNIVASIAIADGSKVEALASDIAKEAAKENGPFELKIGTGKYLGVNLHKATLALPPQADEAARRVFGSTATIAIGTSPKAVHVAIGKNCDESLKKAIDRAAAKPSGQAEMLKMRFALTQLLNYMQTIQPSPVAEAMLNSAAVGNDRVMIDSQSSERGAVVRLTLEDGVMKAIAAGAKAGQGAGGGF